jgi:hypothetical protein
MCGIYLTGLSMIHLCRYLYRACRERYQASNEKDDMLDALAFNMKYVRAEVSTFVSKSFVIYFGVSRSGCLSTCTSFVVQNQRLNYRILIV